MLAYYRAKIFAKFEWKDWDAKKKLAGERDMGKIPTLSSKNGAIFGRVDVRVGGREDTDNMISLLYFHGRIYPRSTPKMENDLKGGKDGRGKRKGSLYKRYCVPHNNVDTSVRGRAARNIWEDENKRGQEGKRGGQKLDLTAGHRWRREGGQGVRGRTHTRAIDGAAVRKISASVYRSGARANQTDIIDLTCDLEIRKITDGERLEPIIIVNIGRPSSHSFTAAAQASYISKVWRP